MYLLDTCALIWLTSDQTKLSKTAHSILTRGDAVIFISPISFFEIGLLQRRKRIKLPCSLLKWTENIFKEYSINEVMINASIAATAVELPELHRDPCDRIIVATAMETDLSILSPDELISQYPRVRVVW